MVHLGVYGDGKGMPAFAVGCVLVGLGLGLVGRLLWTVSGEAGREWAGGESPLGIRPPPGPAHRTADDEPKGNGRQSVRPGGCAAGDVIAARPCCLSGVWRTFGSPK
jgi:hypothetical protein